MSLVVVAVKLRGAASQLFTHEHVLQPAADHDRFQKLTIEMRAVLRIRLRSHIDQHVDAVLPQQPAKMLGRMIGVTNREEVLARVRNMNARHAKSSSRMSTLAL